MQYNFAEVTHCCCIVSVLFVSILPQGDFLDSFKPEREQAACARKQCDFGEVWIALWFYCRQLSDEGHITVYHDKEVPTISSDRHELKIYKNGNVATGAGGAI